MLGPFELPQGRKQVVELENQTPLKAFSGQTGHLGFVSTNSPVQTVASWARFQAIKNAREKERKGETLPRIFFN